MVLMLFYGWLCEIDHRKLAVAGWHFVSRLCATHSLLIAFSVPTPLFLIRTNGFRTNHPAPTHHEVADRTQHAAAKVHFFCLLHKLYILFPATFLNVP